MRTLYNGTQVPTQISTEERIFKIETFDNETVLCNLETAKELLNEGQIKTLWHLWNFQWERLWNFQWERLGKSNLKQMI